MCKIALSATRDSDILSCNVRWLKSDDRKMPESLELSKQVKIGVQVIQSIKGTDTL